MQLEIYNLVGKLIYSENLGTQGKGEHAFTVPMEESSMASAPNGMYICRIRSGEVSQQVRFVLAR